MLSFELKTGGTSDAESQLEIYLDQEGLESLLAQLKLLKEGRTEHVHLMAESWGGHHLEDSPQRQTNTALHHVEILLR